MMNIYKVYFKNGTVLEVKAAGCATWTKDGKLSSVNFSGYESQEVEYIDCSEVIAITREEDPEEEYEKWLVSHIKGEDTPINQK